MTLDEAIAYAREEEITYLPLIRKRAASRWASDGSSSTVTRLTGAELCPTFAQVR
jgi:hypothetical protein